MDVKNIEVSLAKRTPSNTCQSQSLVPSAAAEDSPVILSVTASSSRWKHMQTTAAGCRKISQLWSRKWRTTAASLELRRCSHYWWQSDGKEQSLVSATLPPTKQEEGECVPRDRADTGLEQCNQPGEMSIHHCIQEPQWEGATLMSMTGYLDCQNNCQGNSEKEE